MIERNYYAEAIVTIRPFDQRESQDIQQTLEWLQSAKQIHKPYNMEEHLGVLSLILSPDRKLTFMLNHKKAQMWLPPGGHVNAGQTFEEAVKSEIKEELGVEAKFLGPNPFFLSRTLTHGVDPGHIDVTAWFILEGNPSVTYNVQEKEASEGKWIALSELLNFPDQSNLPRAILKLFGILATDSLH